MKLSISIEGVPVVANERYEVGALAHEIARAHAAGKPITLAVESDSGELLLQSAEKFLCGGMMPATIRDQYGNEFPPNPIRMPAHAEAEARIELLTKELAEAHAAHGDSIDTHAKRERELEARASVLGDELQAAQRDTSDARRDVETWWACAGAAIELCDNYEEVVKGHRQRLERGTRVKLQEIRDAHEAGA